MKQVDFIKKLDTINDLPTLPEIALEVNDMLSKEPVDVGKLSATIENDPAMVTRMLRLVNSSFFGLESKISTVSRAIVILGFEIVRSAVVTVSIIKALQPKKKIEVFDITRFWRHAIAVAVISKNLASMSGITSPEDAFTGGILHDIGKVVMAHFFTDSFEEILEQVQNNESSFYEKEKQFLPMDHTQIGDYLARKWKLPLQLRHAILYHHSINRMDISPTAIIVHFADTVFWHPDGLPAPKESFNDVNAESLNAVLPHIDNIYSNFTNINNEIEVAFKFLVKGK